MLNAREFRSLEHLNEVTSQWLAEVADVRVHRERKRRTIDLHREELPYLSPIPEKPYDTAETACRTAHAEGLVTEVSEDLPIGETQALVTRHRPSSVNPESIWHEVLDCLARGDQNDAVAILSTLSSIGPRSATEKELAVLRTKLRAMGFGCSCNCNCCSKDTEPQQGILRVIQKAESMSEIHDKLGDVSGREILVEKANGCLRDRTRVLRFWRSFGEYPFGQRRVCCPLRASRSQNTARPIGNTA